LRSNNLNLSNFKAGNRPSEIDFISTLDSSSKPRLSSPDVFQGHDEAADHDEDEDDRLEVLVLDQPESDST